MDKGKKEKLQNLFFMVVASGAGSVVALASWLKSSEETRQNQGPEMAICIAVLLALLVVSLLWGPVADRLKVLFFGEREEGRQ